MKRKKRKKTRKEKKTKEEKRKEKKEKQRNETKRNETKGNETKRTFVNFGGLILIGTKKGAGNVVAQQTHDLVVNERQQRRDDDRHAVGTDGWQLVTQTLATSGRHQDECVAASHRGVDDLTLDRAKRVDAKHRVEE